MEFWISMKDFPVFPLTQYFKMGEILDQTSGQRLGLGGIAKTDRFYDLFRFFAVPETAVGLLALFYAHVFNIIDNLNIKY